MDTNDQHQIATEAANQAWNDGLIDQNGKTPLKFIIQAAIEKATEENNLAWGRRIGEKDNEIRALQAELRAASHASEQYPSVGNFVRYANSLYEVAEIRLFPHGYMVGIFDEPPSKHIDYINLANLEQQTAHASEDEKDLTAVPVLAETARPGICDATTEGAEARQAPMNVATAVNPAYENVQQTSNRIETPYEKGQTDSEAVSGSGVQDLRKRTEGLSRKQSAKSKISSQMEGENSGTERQNSQTVSVRELRSDSDTGRASPELREATGSDVALSSLSQRDLTTDSRGGSQPL